MQKTNKQTKHIHKQNKTKTKQNKTKTAKLPWEKNKQGRLNVKCIGVSEFI